MEVLELYDGGSCQVKLDGMLSQIPGGERREVISSVTSSVSLGDGPPSASAANIRLGPQCQSQQILCWRLSTQ